MLIIGLEGAAWIQTLGKQCCVNQQIGRGKLEVEVPCRKLSKLKII